MKDWIIDKNKIFVNKNQTEISYPNDGNAISFQIENNSPWFNQRNVYIKTIISKNNLKGNFLDIGGGNGFQIKALERLKAINNTFLIEPGYKGCLNAKKRGVKNVFCGTFQEFDFGKYDIDICGLFDVIEHIEDDISFLNELYSKIKRNTHIIISVPSLKLLWSDVDIYTGHYRRYNKKDTIRILNNTKFQFVDSGYYFSPYVLPLLVLRVLPFRIGFKKNNEKIKQEEMKNHNQNNFVQTIINKRNKQWGEKIAKGNYPYFGTSMFIVLKK